MGSTTRQAAVLGRFALMGGWNRAFGVAAMRGGSDAAERTYELNSMVCAMRVMQSRVELNARDMREGKGKIRRFKVGYSRVIYSHVT